ncbi:hypothetical protein DSL72_001942 [Monilinia vaccinii-corymbosi]|uniref:Glycosyltransferase family 71 protein n=1 Tax=Monilinia vaccinii-corymbosi TaxID=61207 RepID=A0A8A3PBA3_9HELO|nr:hypothetical protein DSL72_001942 [Monilinia vaccinii-corymbosi]
MLASSRSKRGVTLIVTLIFIFYLTFRDKPWSLETPIFLREPLDTFGMSATHPAPSSLTNVFQPINILNSAEVAQIANLIRQLNTLGPPALTKPAACTGRTLAIEDVTNDTERRDVTPVSDEQVAQARKAHTRVVDMIRKSSHSVPYKAHTRGIVTVAGGRYTGALLVTLRMLRRTNSTLPVQVFMPTAGDYDQNTCEVILPSLNARCVMIPQYEGLSIAKFQYKIFAVLLSSFEEVLFLDADNFPIVDPAAWMGASVFKDTGYVLVRAFLSPHQGFNASILKLQFGNARFLILDYFIWDAELYSFKHARRFLPPPKAFAAPRETQSLTLTQWPDFWWATASPHYFQVANHPTPSLLSLGTTESGQLIISKRTHSDVLLLALYYNIFGPPFYYPLLTQCDAGQGDKETWLYAVLALGKRYYQVKQKTGILGYHSDDGFHGASMTQQNPQDDYSTYRQEREHEHALFRDDDAPDAVFLHHNLVKLSPVEMVAWVRANPGRRMWGGKKGTVARFGVDLEGAVWEELVRVACGYGDGLVGWNQDVCGVLMENWRGIVWKEALEERAG